MSYSTLVPVYQYILDRYMLLFHHQSAMSHARYSSVHIIMFGKCFYNWFVYRSSHFASWGKISTMLPNLKPRKKVISCSYANQISFDSFSSYLNYSTKARITFLFNSLWFRHTHNETRRQLRFLLLYLNLQDDNGGLGKAWTAFLLAWLKLCTAVAA